MPLPNPETLQAPDNLRETVLRVHGERGRQWLAHLPSLILECRERWSLLLDLPFDNLSYNLVIPGQTEQGADVVLKLGVPCRELLTEAAALDLFKGVGAVRLLDHEAKRGILLMERARPGQPLYRLQDDSEATATAARLMLRLWRNAPIEEKAFPSLADWFQAFKRLRSRFNGESGPFSAELIEKGERTFSELSETQERTVVLHADLHHDNILSYGSDGWVAIDPKGISGDPGYEVGPFMLNQLPAGAHASAVKAILKRRLSIFSDELKIGRERLARWAFCHALLSALWDFEEAAEWHSTIRVAEMLYEFC